MDFGREMREDQKSPFNEVTNYGKVWKMGAGKPGMECGSTWLLVCHVTLVFINNLRYYNDCTLR